MSEFFTRASASLGSFNSETRTVKAILATETPVRRRSWESGDYDEVLISSRDAIDSSRIDGLAVLDAHNQNGLDNRVGSVVPGSLRFLTGAAEVTIKLSRNEKGEAVFRDLEDGHLLGLSVGYRIEKTETTKAASGGVATIRATRWQPLELSFVSVPADPNAKTRSEETDMSHPRLRTQNRPLTDAEQQQRAEEQRQRHDIETRTMTEEEAGQFVRACSDAGLIPETAREAIEAHVTPGMSRAQMRAAMLEVMSAHQSAAPTFPHVEACRMGNANIRGALTDALMVRVNPAHKPQNDAFEFVGMSVVEIARECLERSGQSGRGHAHDVVQRGLHSSSDFSAVLGDVTQTVLAGAYTASPSPLKALAWQVSVKDFREKTTARLSEFSDLEPVLEGGEYTSGSYQEGSESYRVQKYGKKFALTFELMVNDQLGVFANAARDIGATVARLEADLLAKVINENPKMKNGKSIFHADHKNLAGTGAILSETSLSAARLAVMKQTGLAGELIDIYPKFLVVAPEQQTGAEKLLAHVQAATVDDVNPFAGRLQLVVDRRLAANAWYIAADPAQAQSLEIAYIAGMEFPDIRSREGFNVDGMEFRVRHIVGVGWVDHRGWFKNPGL